ncbi:hypothetical protein ABW19_dt0200556 [Dactylella cylindrospora]|nr:hypothetical protein ABW19_dt0200556 [Dactylella cylindrospora]
MGLLKAAKKIIFKAKTGGSGTVEYRPAAEALDVAPSIAPELELVHEPLGHEPRVNIILVPSFGCDHEEIRTSLERPTKGSGFWPKDLLPSRVPGSRVFITKFTPPIGPLSASSYRWDLYSLLPAFRQEIENQTGGDKPIVFIAHQLGATLVEGLFNEISVEFEKDAICRKTIAIFFVGASYHLDSVLKEPRTDDGKSLASFESALDEDSLKSVSERFANVLSKNQSRLPSIARFPEAEFDDVRNDLIDNIRNILRQHVPRRVSLGSASNYSSITSTGDTSTVCSSLWKPSAPPIILGKSEKRQGLHHSLGLPTRNRHFWGREDLLEDLELAIRGLQDRPHNLLADVAVEGAPGSGKTEVVKELCYKLASPDLGVSNIFWIDGRSKFSILRSLASFHKHLFIPIPGDEPNEISKSMAVLEWLLDTSGINIIVIDGVRSTDVFKMLYLLRGSHVKIIMTTKDPDVARTNSVVQFQLDVFTSAEWAEYFYQHGVSEAESSLMEQLGIVYQHDPKVITFLLQEFRVPFGNKPVYYTDICMESRQKLVFKAFWDQIPDSAKDILLILSLFPLGTDILPEVFQRMDEDGSTLRFLLFRHEGGLGIPPWDPWVGTPDIFLVWRENDDGLTVFQVLPALHELVSWASLEADKLRSLHKRFLLGICTALDLHRKSGFSHPHVFAAIIEPLMESNTENLRSDLPPNIRLRAELTMGLWMAEYKYWFGDLEGAEALFQKILKGQEKFRQSQSPIYFIEVPICQFKLAKIYHDARDYKRLSLMFDEIESTSNDQLTSNDINTDFELGILRAETFVRLGRSNEALHILNWLKIKAERDFGPRSLQYYSCFYLNILGAYVNNDLGQADKAAQELLWGSLLEASVGSDFVAKVHKLRSSILWGRGKYEAALHEAMKAAERFQGQTSLRLRVFGADLLLRAGRYGDAKKILWQALEEYRSAGLSHISDAQACKNLFIKAIHLSGEVVSENVFEQIPVTNIGWEWLGYNRNKHKTLIIQALLAEGRGNFKQAIEIQEQIWHGRHEDAQTQDPEIQEVMVNLGRLYATTGQYKLSEKILSKLYEHLKIARTEKHIEAISVLRQLGSTYLRMGQLKKAVEAFTRVSEQLDQNPLPADIQIELVLCKVELAFLLKDESPSEERPEFGDTITQMRLAFDRDHPSLLAAYLKYAVVLMETGRLKEADVCLDRAQKGFLRRSWGSSGTNLQALAITGRLYFEQGKSEEAKSLLKQLSAEMQVDQQWSYPETLQAYRDLLDVLGEGGLDPSLMQRINNDIMLYTGFRMDSENLGTNPRFLVLVQEHQKGAGKVGSSKDQVNPCGFQLISGPLIMPSKLLETRKLFTDIASDQLKSLTTLVQGANGVMCMKFLDTLEQLWGQKSGYSMDRVAQSCEEYTTEGAVALWRLRGGDATREGAADRPVNLLEILPGLLWISSVFNFGFGDDTSKSEKHSRRCLTMVTPQFKVTHCYSGIFKTENITGWEGMDWIASREENRISLVEIWFQTREYQQSTMYSCWTKLFLNTRIFELRNIQATHLGYGLKLDFDVLVQISGVHRPVEHHGGLILIGYQTALIPMKRLADSSIAWHLVVQDDQVTRYVADSEQFKGRLKVTDLNKLKGTAYLGWSENVIQVLGLDSNLPMATMTETLPTEGKAFSLGQVIVQGGLASTFPPVTGALNIQGVFQAAPIKLKFSPRSQLEASINQSWNYRLIVYDESTKTAWMVSKLHLILYMMRCYIERNSYRDRELRIGLAGSGTLDGLRDLIMSEKERWDADIKSKGLGFEDIFGMLCQAITEGVDMVKALPMRRKIYGVELVDILDGREDAQARSFRFTASVEQWAFLAKNRGVIVCSNIGNPLQIQQATNPDAGCHLIPINKDLLACAVKDFEVITNRPCQRRMKRVCGQVDWSWNRAGVMAVGGSAGLKGYRE